IRLTHPSVRDFLLVAGAEIPGEMPAQKVGGTLCIAIIGEPPTLDVHLAPAPIVRQCAASTGRGRRGRRPSRWAGCGVGGRDSSPSSGARSTCAWLRAAPRD